MYFRLLSVLIALFTYANTFGQEEVSNSMYLGLSYSSQWPSADLGDRFGRSNGIGISSEFLVKGKWTFSLDGQFIFGRNIKENTLGEILTPEGELIDNTFNLALLDITERGYLFTARAGQILDLFHPAHISGLKWTVGAGYFQHKIRYRDDNSAILLFNDDYIKGYDRLSSGLAITEFIGYQFLDERGTLNFFAGLEFAQAFTKNRRKYNYNTRSTDTDLRFDLLISLRAGIQITIRSFKDPDDIIY